MAHPDSLKVRRAFGALLWGAVLGAFLTALVFVMPALFAVGSDVPHPEQVARLAALIFGFSFIFWVIGLLAIGAPFWAALHARGHKGYVSAASLGFILTAPVLLLLSVAPGGTQEYCGAGGVCSIKDGRLTPEGWAIAFQTSLIFGLIGLAVGLYIRFLAYRND